VHGRRLLREIEGDRARGSRVELTRVSSDSRAEQVGAEGPPPAEVEAIIVGAGIGGIQTASELHSVGVTDIALLERSSSLGGVWRWHANPYSRVNTSEPAYRLTRAGYTPKSRQDKNTNHTPAFQMLRDQIDTLVALGLDRRVYTGSEVLEVRTPTSNPNPNPNLGLDRRVYTGSEVLVVTAVGFERDLPHACLRATYGCGSAIAPPPSSHCRAIRTRSAACMPTCD
jgi:hypothetical protein